MGSFANIPERLISHIWQHQLFSHENLRTPDGRPVIVLSPGNANYDGGPDFKDARIRINQITYYGDVEVHRDAASWRSHSHDTDPHYNKVILHVVMTADPLVPPASTVSQRTIPLLVLHPYLDPAMRTAWVQTHSDPLPPARMRLPCAVDSRKIPADLILHWLIHLASERLELKIRRFQERLQQLADEGAQGVREPYARYHGDPAQIPSPRHEISSRNFSKKDIWEQVLYEGVMEGLGYAKNRKPFLTLARSMTLNRLRRYPLDDTTTMMALLLGAAGLLPSSRGLPEKESRTTIRRLRRRWKMLRHEFRIPLLHEADWLFFRLRPVNFPTARLAAFCYILPSLFGEESFRTLIGIFKKEGTSPEEKRKEIRRMFAIVPDEFWKRHYQFGGFAGRWGASLGRDRIHEILVNTLLPIVLLYARIFRERSIQNSARELYESMPPSPPNSVTILLEQELLHGRVPLRSAFLQQGALQLFSFYCEKKRCEECEVGRACDRKSEL